MINQLTQGFETAKSLWWPIKFVCIFNTLFLIFIKDKPNITKRKHVAKRKEKNITVLLPGHTFI